MDHLLIIQKWKFLKKNNAQDNIDYSLPFDCWRLLGIMTVLQLEALCVCVCACDSADCLEC